MKKFLSKLIFLSFVALVFLFGSKTSAQEQKLVCAVYFTSLSCPHCADASPVIFGQLPTEYPNFLLVEYELSQHPENGPLFMEYNERYNSGLGIPLIIFNKNTHIIGGSPIVRGVRDVLGQFKENGCPLVDGANVGFKDLNITSLSGEPTIWHQGRVLIKTGSGGENKLLKDLLTGGDLNKVLKGVEFEKIGPSRLLIAGGSVKFDNAIKVEGWTFQWNGEGLDMSVISHSEEKSGDRPEEKPTVSLEEKPMAALVPPEVESGHTYEPGPGEIESKLTLAKVLSLAAVDAVNPCAIAVLSLMLIAILSYSPGKKRDVLLAGLAFVFSVFIMYLIYGLIIIKSFQLVQTLSAVRLWLYKILGIGAMVMGGFKMKDFFQSKKGVCKPNPRVEKIISKVTSPKGAFLVGAFVTIFLLPCTIGPYIICGGILCPLGILKSLPWLLFYNLIFVLPMLAVVLVIYLGLSKIEDISSWQAKNMKYLDLVSGLIILGLGIAMLLGLV